MNHIWIAYLSVFGFATVACFTGAYRARRAVDNDFRTGLMWLFILAGVWSLTTTARIAVPDMRVDIALRIGGLIIGLASIGAWLYVASAYAGFRYHQSTINRALALAVYLVIVIAKITNPIHNLYFISAQKSLPFLHLSFNPGPLYWFVAGIAYTAVSIGLYWLFTTAPQARVDTTRFRAVLALTAAPALLDVLVYADAIPTVLIEVSYAPLGMAFFALGTATVTNKELYSVSQSWRRQALDDIADAVVLTDAEGRIRYLGSNATAVFSTLAESEGQLFETVAPELSNLTHNSESFQWDQDGATKYYNIIKRDIRSSGSQSGTVFAYIDVTESREARLQLAETEIKRQRFQQAIEAVDHSVFMTDVRGTIEYINPAFEKNTGYDRSTLIGRSPAILNAPDAPNAYPDDLWEQIQDTDGRETEVIQQRQDGTTYYTQQTITPINSQDASTTSYVVILTDITELKEHQQHLELLSRVLRHNLRNDMNIARGYAETMISNTTDSNENYTANIVTTANDVITLAEQSTTITDLIIDPPESQEINLSDVAQQTAERISETYTRASIDIDCKETPPVRAIPQVRTAIEELINNAIIHSTSDTVSMTDEFNRDTTVTHSADDESMQSLSLVSLPRSPDAAKARVSVTVERLPTENEVVVRVEDENQPIPGMDRQILQRGTEIRSVYHGSGLGLWLVYWVVMRSNGTVDVETRDPSGNRIEMRFNQC